MNLQVYRGLPCIDKCGYIRKRLIIREVQYRGPRFNVEARLPPPVHASLCFQECFVQSSNIRELELLSQGTVVSSVCALGKSSITWDSLDLPRLSQPRLQNRLEICRDCVYTASASWTQADRILATIQVYQASRSIIHSQITADRKPIWLPHHS